MLDQYFNKMAKPEHIHIPYSNREEWEKRRQFIKEQFARCLGLDICKKQAPLDFFFGESLDRKDYLLRRIYFSVTESLYASGLLYIPKISGKLPAVLNLIGHWENGAMHPTVQSRCIGLAKKGYVAFAVDPVHIHPSDPGLRDYDGSYSKDDPEGAPCYCNRHGYGTCDMPGLDAELYGINTATVHTYTNIRALDLLASLHYVDENRIGCTGASGGCMQTLYMIALDDRIKAAVPAVYVTYMHRMLNPSDRAGHCNCMVVNSILRYTDMPELAALFAPRPLLFLTVAGDWTREFQKEEYPEIANIYRLYGEEDKIRCRRWNITHDYSKPMREQMYSWFNKWLKGIADPAEAAEPDIRPEDLDTLKGLNILRALDYRFLPEIGDFCDKDCRLEALPQNTQELNEYTKNLKNALSYSLNDIPVNGRITDFYYSEGIDGLLTEKIRVQSEEGIEVPLLLVRAENSGPHPLVIILHSGGKNEVMNRLAQLPQSLAENGMIVAIPDVRLCGELSRKWFYNTICFGRPEAGMALTDIRACLDALIKRDDVDSGRITLLGMDEAGALALIAGALESRIGSIVVNKLGIVYSEGRWQPMIPGILRIGDLEHISATIAPRRLLIGGVNNREKFDFTSRSYYILKACDKLLIQNDEFSAADLNRYISL